MSLDDFSEDEFVFHGSAKLFEEAKPVKSLRYGVDKNGNRVIKFNEVSFHATRYKWMAISYTNSRVFYKNNEESLTYTQGVSLYKYDESVGIWGFESLEDSLEKMYGNGGYVYVFSKDKFFHKDGLGDLEVMTKEELKPEAIIRVDDPIKELKKYGIEFDFIDQLKEG